MANTTFVDYTTPIVASWLNDINNTVYNLLGNGTLAPPDRATIKANLGAASAGANSDITSLSGLTTPLSIAQGGTGANNATTALTNLGATTVGAAVFIAASQAAAQTALGLVPNVNIAQITSATGSLLLPSGTSAQRDVSPSFGYTRANSTSGQLEWWNGTTWTAVGAGATGAGGDQVFVQNQQTVTTSYNIPSGYNAMSTGPITINNGVTVQVPNNSFWVIL